MERRRRFMTSAARSQGTDVIAETSTWYPQRAGLRYSFVAAVEVVDHKSGQQVMSKTANVSHSGCHVRTPKPFNPGTIVKLTPMARGKRFHSERKLISSISNEETGIRFDNVESPEQTTRNEWSLHASRDAQ